MAVEMNAEYRGTLSCEARHTPSGVVLETDAPVDNQGRGASFSPTDLLGAAFATCVLTTMGIRAPGKGIAFEHGKARVLKHMTQDGPRRVAELEVEIELAGSHSEAERKALEEIAFTCPVALSLNPETRLSVQFRYV